MAAIASVNTPTMLHAGPSHLVLEALLPLPVDDARFWEEAGRAVGALHATSGPAHGWHQENWPGMLAQTMPCAWTAMSFYPQPEAIMTSGTIATGRAG